MKNRKYDWFPVIFLSLIVQLMSKHLLLFIEGSFDHSVSWLLLYKINFLLIAVIGGFVAMHFYIKSSFHIGGICATLFVICSQLYLGHLSLTVNGLFVLLLAYVAGYGGSLIYSNQLAHKKFR
jgi:hypothetical protein